MTHLPANEIVATTFYTIDKILESGERGPDVLVLYFKYIEQSRIQGNNQTYSLDSFMAKKLNWSLRKLQYNKDILKELGLIDQIIIKEKGKKNEYYVRVNFMIDNNKVRENNTSLEITKDTANALGDIPANALGDIQNTFIPNNLLIEEKTDILELLGEELVQLHKNQIICLWYMIELGYKVRKDSASLLKEIEWIKEKADIYGYRMVDGGYDWNTIKQRFDRWYNFHKEKGDKIERYKSSVLQFLDTNNSFKGKQKR